ncbi:MAG: hypothetical protein WDM78_16845 [Puia sp.]
MAILNLLTGKNYYTDVLLFEFLIIGARFFCLNSWPGSFPRRIGMYFLLVFFIPSVVFWCSGIRAEGLLLFSTVLMIYNGQAMRGRPGSGRSWDASPVSWAFF